MKTDSDYLFDAARREPSLMLEELRKLDAEERLIDYVRLMWHVIEPVRPLVEGWVLEMMCEHLEAVHRGEIAQILFNVPPGFMKSLLVNVFFPTWEWGPKNRPDLRYVSFSYDSGQTARDNRKSRQLITSPLYQRLWGDRFKLSRDQNQVTDFATTAHGRRLATSVGGPGTGERGDRVVIDDAHKVSQVESDVMRNNVRRWYSNEIVTRVNDDAATVIAIGQRTHLQDVYALMLREGMISDWVCIPMEFEEKNRCFTTVKREGVEPEEVAMIHPTGESIPRWITRSQVAEEIEEGNLKTAEGLEWQWLYCQDPRTTEGELAWPERFSREFLETRIKRGLRADGGNYAIAAQLQQRPIPREGGMFQRSDFTNFLEKRPQVVQWVRGWDLAGTKKKTSPFTASTLMGVSGEDVVVADSKAIQEEPRGVYAHIAQVVIQDGPNVLHDFPQDPGQAGKDQKRHIRSMIRDLAAEHPELHEVKIRFSPETGSKEVRATGLASDAEAGTLYLVRGEWNDAFIDEFCLFPGHEIKDRVDSASRAHARVVKSKSQDGGVSGPEVIRG